MRRQARPVAGSGADGDIHFLAAEVDEFLRDRQAHGDTRMRDLKVAESQCIVGEGKMPIPGIFRQLRQINYPGYVNLEYEIDADNPLPGMKQSFAYMRGVLAGLD